MNNKKKAIAVIVSSVGINLILGLNYTWSIIGNELMLKYNWTGTEAALPYTTGILVLAIFMVFGGRLGDVFGPRLSVIIGGTLLGGGLFLSSFMTTSFAIMITYGLMAGAGTGFCAGSTTATAIKWFPISKKGMVSGICMAGAAFAAVYISPIVHSLLLSYDIESTFRFLGIGAFILIMIFAIFIHKPEDSNKIQEENELSKPQPAAIAKEYGWKEMIKTSTYYKLWFTFILGASAGLMIIGSIANIAVKQADWENGFLLVILLAVFNGIGRFTAGTVSDKIGFRNTLRIVLILQAVNMALFSFYNTTVLLGIGSAVAGLCYGGIVSLYPAATASAFGVKNLGTNYALVNTAYGVGGILGPVMIGAILDATGSYHFAYLGSAALLILALFITVSMKKRKKVNIVVEAIEEI